MTDRTDPRIMSALNQSRQEANESRILAMTAEINLNTANAMASATGRLLAAKDAEIAGLRQDLVDAHNLIDALQAMLEESNHKPWRPTPAEAAEYARAIRGEK